MWHRGKIHNQMSLRNPWASRKPRTRPKSTGQGGSRPHRQPVRGVQGTALRRAAVASVDGGRGAVGAQERVGVLLVLVRRTRVVVSGRRAGVSCWCVVKSLWNGGSWGDSARVGAPVPSSVAPGWRTASLKVRGRERVDAATGPMVSSPLEGGIGRRAGQRQGDSGEATASCPGGSGRSLRHAPQGEREGRLDHVAPHRLRKNAYPLAARQTCGLRGTCTEGMKWPLPGESPGT